MRYTDGIETIVAAGGRGLRMEGNQVVACYLSG
jgi:hypothetical protein